MTHQVLARKYRPRSFKDMVGQEAILRILTNALLQKRLHHAYLLTGTRGVGKTTIARILAKCLNCDGGITPNPCGTCHTCKAIDGGQFLDLYEIDAASRTKVEDTRELLDNVPYPPTQGRYKVYLIDEVHMLSNHSFNALLKTLEEPPEYVIFILATTDPKKLPITILSRCLQFYLKRITPEKIAKHLQHICETESITFDASALAKLSQAADGSMRDALSLLDQAIAYGHGAVNHDDVHAMIGSLSQEDLLPLVEAIAALDGPKVFALAAELAERAPDFHQVLEELIHVFHQLAVLQVLPQAGSSNKAFIALSKAISAEDTQLYYQIALLGRRDLAITPSPQQGFEMTLLRMLAFKPATVIQRSAATKDLEIPRSARDDSSSARDNSSSVQANSSSVRANSIAAQGGSTADRNDRSADWRDILPKLSLSGMAYALASNCVLEKVEGSRVELALGATHQPMLNPKLKERITEALSQHFDKSIQLEIKLSTAELATPIKQQQHEQQEQLSGAKQAVLQNPQVKNLIDMYDATVEVALLS